MSHVIKIYQQYQLTLIDSKFRKLNYQMDSWPYAVPVFDVNLHQTPECLCLQMFTLLQIT